MNDNKLRPPSEHIRTYHDVHWVQIAMTLTQAAGAVHVSEKSLLRAIKATEPPYLKAKRWGRGYRISPADLQEWFDSLPDA